MLNTVDLIKLIQGINYVREPGFDLSDFSNPVGGNGSVHWAFTNQGVSYPTYARSDDYAWTGSHSLKISPGVGTTSSADLTPWRGWVAGDWNFVQPPKGAYVVSFYAYRNGAGTGAVKLQISGAYTLPGSPDPDDVVQGTVLNAANSSWPANTWTRYTGFYFSDGTSGSSKALFIQINPDSSTWTSGDIYIDAVQIERVDRPDHPTTKADFQTEYASLDPNDYVTDYFDGFYRGCRWLGEPGLSYSMRELPHGGRHLNLDEDLGFTMYNLQGIGMPDVDLRAVDRTTLDGSMVPAMRNKSRTISLSGAFLAARHDRLPLSDPGLKVLHDWRQLVVDLVRQRFFSRGQVYNMGLRYTGATKPKRIMVNYDSGLEFRGGDGFNENITSLRMLAPDPVWVGDSLGGVEWTNVIDSSSDIRGGILSPIEGFIHTWGLADLDDSATGGTPAITNLFMLNWELPNTRVALWEEDVVLFLAEFGNGEAFEYHMWRPGIDPKPVRLFYWNSAFYADNNDWSSVNYIGYFDRKLYFIFNYYNNGGGTGQAVAILSNGAYTLNNQQIVSIDIDQLTVNEMTGITTPTSDMPNSMWEYGGGFDEDGKLYLRRRGFNGFGNFATGNTWDNTDVTWYEGDLSTNAWTFTSLELPSQTQNWYEAAFFTRYHGRGGFAITMENDASPTDWEVWTAFHYDGDENVDQGIPTWDVRNYRRRLVGTLGGMTTPEFYPLDEDHILVHMPRNTGTLNGAANTNSSTYIATSSGSWLPLLDISDDTIQGGGLGINHVSAWSSESFHVGDLRGRTRSGVEFRQHHGGVWTGSQWIRSGFGGYYLLPTAGDTLTAFRTNVASTAQRLNVQTFTCDSGHDVYPVIVLESTGSFFHTYLAEILLFNGQHYASLRFRDPIKAGEKVVLDLRPQQPKTWSNYGHDRWILDPASDLLNFYLRPGENQIWFGANAVDDLYNKIKVNLYWERLYLSADDSLS